MSKLCQYIEENFLPAIREGGRGRARVPRRHLARPTPLRSRSAGRLRSDPPRVPDSPPPSDRRCRSSGRGRLWDPTTTLGFAGTPNDRTLLGTEWPSVEGEEEEKKKNECKQRGQRERGALARAIAREEGIVTRSPWRTGTTTTTPSSSPSPASSAPSSSL